MKKALKITLAFLGVLLIIAISFIIYYLAVTSPYNINEKNLVDLNTTVTFYDIKGNELCKKAKNNVSVTDISSIPENAKNAFIAIEDKRFYSHNGVDNRALLRAIFNNITSFSFKEGASTITQQLVKNTQLSGEKTIKRKLIEYKLAKQMEKKYSKEQILEKYLNTIYFGDGCFGITKASEHYFGVMPESLTLTQCATLAAIVKSPANYSPFTNPENCENRRNLVLKEMLSQKMITESEYNSAILLPLQKTLRENSNFYYDYSYVAGKELSDFLENNAYKSKKYNVYTYCEPYLQQKAIDTISDFSDIDTEKSVEIIDKYGKITAFASTCKENLRQMGSTIKPLIVYAPAIENNVLDECSLLLDEKTDFNGYSPKNYNNKYYGYISVKDAVKKSSNVCAVKTLNYTGIDKSLYFLKKTDIPLTENDNSLSLALGSTEKGATLTQILSAYSVFMNNGFFIKPKSIFRITGENGEILYESTLRKTPVFSEDTTYIMNDILKETVNSGTAKKLSLLGKNLYAKTGTCGFEKGNTDAYSISYNKNYSVGVWFGNKNNSLMDNTITGGSYPTAFSAKIWKEIFNIDKSDDPFFSPDSIEKKLIDKISYEEQNEVILADPNAPLRYTFNAFFKKNRIPEKVSDRFSSPKIEIKEYLINNNEFSVSLCQTEYIKTDIYKTYNGKKIKIYSGNINEKFSDNDILPNTIYEYSFIPYFINSEGNKFYGKEIFLPKIKSPSNLGDWWNE